MLGTCDKVIISKENTTIVNGAGQKELIQERINQIKAEIKNSTSDYDKEKLQERLAKLSRWCSSSLCRCCQRSGNERKERPCR